jgi:hypothetical protein
VVGVAVVAALAACDEDDSSPLPVFHSDGKASPKPAPAPPRKLPPRHK